MSLGQKQYSSINMGIKHIARKMLGNKIIPAVGTQQAAANALLTQSPNGVIQNYSNSELSAREPIKGVSPISKLKPMQIEKSKKGKEILYST